MPDVHVENLRKTYGDVVALEDVDLHLRQGEFHALVGPNGSGKTTLLRILLGLTPPSSGRLDVPDLRLGVAFQRPSFYEELTVAENLRTFGAFVNADPEWVAELRERLGLNVVTERVAGDLSGGYERKLDLALALAKEPDFLLLDEPLGDLDDVTKLRLVEFLEDYRNRGHGIVVSTHNLAEFSDSIDRLTVVIDGEVRARGHRSDLPEDLQRYYLETAFESDQGGATHIPSDER
jgi:ABC-2 type transport system ATP-binding protein